MRVIKIDENFERENYLKNVNFQDEFNSLLVHQILKEMLRENVINEIEFDALNKKRIEQYDPIKLQLMPKWLDK